MTKKTKYPSPEAQELKELENLFNNKNYSELEVKTNSLIQKYPNIPIMYNILGVSQSSRGMFQQSITNFEKAIKLNPKLLDAYNNLGLAQKKCKKYFKALETFQQALNIDINHHLINFNF